MGPASEAQKKYEAFINGTEEVTDPMRKGARAYLLMAQALSKVMSAQTGRVKGVADDMSVVHDYMSKLNEVVQLAGPAAATDGKHYAVFSSPNEDDVYEFRAAFLLAADLGSNPNDYVYYETLPGPPVQYTWGLMISECNTALTNLRFQVDDLSSLSSQEQMRLQTLMTNLNNAIESATAGIQKAGTQAQSANHALEAQ
jgi:hypothetical protein